MTGDPGLESRRLASRSAQVLLLGAGLVTVLNASVSHLHGVNVAASVAEIGQPADFIGSNGDR